MDRSSNGCPSIYKEFIIRKQDTFAIAKLFRKCVSTLNAKRCGKRRRGCLRLVAFNCRYTRTNTRRVSLVLRPSTKAMYTVLVKGHKERRRVPGYLHEDFTPLFRKLINSQNQVKKREE